MHIMEGYLPGIWSLFWFLVSMPFLLYGMYQVKKVFRDRREALPLLAVAGAFVFVLSSLKLPSITGSCSHPTGTGLAAILFGPAAASILGVIVLLYQALFLAHGGLSTLGANVFSMGIAGPLAAYGIYRAGRRLNLNTYATVFLAAAIADLSTYVVTSLQLALAFPAGAGGVWASFVAFGYIFAITHVPLAILEGVVTGLIFKYIIDLRPDILVRLNVLPAQAVARVKEARA